MRLSVLDQSPISEGSTGADALRSTVDLARLTDALGYRRYWLAEHHGTPMLASTSPEVLIAAVADATARIRVGSGGVMLPHYSPLKVAELFSVLSALHPGRIDLGVGRAPGTDPVTTFALQRDRRHAAPDDFPDQLAELLAYLDGSLPPDHPFARLAALPGAPELPEPWLLGSSPQSAIWAAQLGLPYAFADFINPTGAEIASLYRERFQPSKRLAQPYVCVAVSVVSAETEAEAQRLAASGRMTFRMLRQGQPIRVPPPEKALAFLAEANASAPGDGSGHSGTGAVDPATRRRGIVGDPEAVKNGIEKVAAEYGADEAMIVTITYDHTARRRSYELVAEAFAQAGTRPAQEADPHPAARA